MTGGVDVTAGSPARAARLPFDAALGAVGLLTLLALALRLPHIGESLVGDEMYAFAEVHDRSFTEVFERVREGGENSPPLFFVLAWFAMKLGGDPTELIRLPSLVLGTALVPLVYVLGLRTVGRTAALIGALFATLSPFAIYYSSEARPYATLTFFVALSTLLLLIALERRRAVWWVAYAVTGSLCLYAHYFALFPLMAQGAWALYVHRDQWRAIVLANVGVVVGYVPWLLAFLDQKGNSISILAFYAPLTWQGARRELLRLFPGHPSFTPSELPGTEVVVLVWLAVAVALAAALLVRARAGTLAAPGPRVVLVALLAVATPVGFTIYSALGPEVFIGRYMNGAVPGLVLTLGAILAAAPRAVGIASTVIVAGCLGVGAVQSLEEQHRRPAYKEVAHFIDRTARPGDAVVQLDLTLGATKSQVTKGGRQLSLDVNFDRPHNLISAFEENDVVPAYARAARRPRLLLVGPVPLPAPPPGLGARLVEQRTFGGLLPLEVKLYTPTDPARGFTTTGLEEAEEQARLRGRKVAAVRDCLAEAGYRARRAETSPPGSIALETRLRDGGRALFYVYMSPGRAEQELPGIQRFLETSGGRAVRHADTVVGYTGDPAAPVTSPLEACARAPRA
jgi:hypothetical protein